MTTYGYTIIWGRALYQGRGYPTMAEAKAAQNAIFDQLKKEGWTQPRWWQWWRANDTRRSVIKEQFSLYDFAKKLMK